MPRLRKCNPIDALRKGYNIWRRLFCESEWKAGYFAALDNLSEWLGIPEKDWQVYISMVLPARPEGEQDAQAAKV